MRVRLRGSARVNEGYYKMYLKAAHSSLYVVKNKEINGIYVKENYVINIHRFLLSKSFFFTLRVYIFYVGV